MANQKENAKQKALRRVQRIKKIEGMCLKNLPPDTMRKVEIYLLCQLFYGE